MVYEDFIISILTEEFNIGTFSTKKDIRDWLIEKDLIDVALPKFIREDKYFYVDEQGILRSRKEDY